MSGEEQKYRNIFCALCAVTLPSVRLHSIVHMFDHLLTSYKSESEYLDLRVQKWVNMTIKYKRYAAMWN